MIRRYDPKEGKLRGLGTVPVQVNLTKKRKRGDKPLDPFFWAAFQLSGDWR